MVAKLAAAVSWIALIALSLTRTPVPDPPLGSHCSCERGICPLDSNGRRCSCGCAKRADAQPVQQLDAKVGVIVLTNADGSRADNFAFEVAEFYLTAAKGPTLRVESATKN